MDIFIELAKFLGGIAGVVALVWRIFDEFSGYLRIGLKTEQVKNGWIFVLTTIENKGNRLKNISQAFLLIGSEDESPVETTNYILGDKKIQ